MATAFAHQPVLVDETLDLLAPRSLGHYVDATVGGAGHASAVLDASSPDGRLLGVDRDPNAVAVATERLAPYGERARVVTGRYGQLDQVLERNAFGTFEDGRWRVDGLLVDAGVSSHQLDSPDRGFSFQNDGPLDMRMSQSGPTCAELIDALSPDELADRLRRYGEVERAGRIARGIKTAREAGELQSTGQLAKLVESLAPAPRRRGARKPIHPATKVFQALRIAVNEELDDLERLCDGLPDLLASGGVAVIISFHSLEDRIVKRALRRHASAPPVPAGVPLRESERQAAKLELLTRRPVTAGDDEIEANPRARSARLRAARRLGRLGQPGQEDDV